MLGKKQRLLLMSLLTCVIWVSGFYVVFGAFYFSGVRVNVSSSLPHIFWVVRKIEQNEQICNGDFVVVNPHEIDSSDFTPIARQLYFNDRWLFIKQIGGVAGQVIEDNDEVIVLSSDSEGNSLPKYPLPVRLEENQYWLVSDKKRGFDSRYFGAVRRSVIKAKAFPLFNKEEKNNEISAI